jgi:hypothetical protein
MPKSSSLTRAGIERRGQVDGDALLLEDVLPVVALHLEHEVHHAGAYRHLGRRAVGDAQGDAGRGGAQDVGELVVRGDLAEAGQPLRDLLLGQLRAHGEHVLLAAAHVLVGELADVQPWLISSGTGRWPARAVAWRSAVMRAKISSKVERRSV